MLFGRTFFSNRKTDYKILLSSNLFKSVCCLILYSDWSVALTMLYKISTVNASIWIHMEMMHINGLRTYNVKINIKKDKIVCKEMFTLYLQKESPLSVLSEI